MFECMPGHNRVWLLAAYVITSCPLCDPVYEPPTKTYVSWIPVAFSIPVSRDYETPASHALLGVQERNYTLLACIGCMKDIHSSVCNVSGL